ncbi:hypothetical protein EVAR_94396_1 [Eumeta japonica]|uniref:Uncharacterized protein n=1 Tax=Eumeta variegata TaxID=151549 RepID=A0A4C1TQ03_EUMVA|nr:hypothetical protein EVAR_94396_1 [Eumeta japonica]
MHVIYQRVSDHRRSWILAIPKKSLVRHRFFGKSNRISDGQGVNLPPLIQRRFMFSPRTRTASTIVVSGAHRRRISGCRWRTQLAFECPRSIDETNVFRGMNQNTRPRTVKGITTKSRPLTFQPASVGGWPAAPRPSPAYEPHNHCRVFTINRIIKKY